jgi:aminoglycoside phosphotransferase (APT) family kinase protein
MRCAARAPDAVIRLLHFLSVRTLSNVFIGPDGAVGFIDCGHAVRGDPYLDLQILAAEIADHFGSGAVKAFARVYGVQRWNVRKAAYTPISTSSSESTSVRAVSYLTTSVPRWQ